MQFGVWVDLDQVCAPMWPRPDLRSRSRSRSFRSCAKCTFLGLSPPPFWRGAQKWWLIMIVGPYACWSPIFEFPSTKAVTRVQTSPNVDISPNSNGHISLSAWWYSHVVGHAGSPTCTVYVDLTLIRSKVKVKVTGLLNFRKLQFSRSISTILVWSSKLTTDYDSMGPSLQLITARFLGHRQVMF